MKRYIGVDPGKSGAIAVLNSSEVATFKFNNTERDIWGFFEDMTVQPSFAVIEKVHSMPKQGVKSSFTFGQSYGFLRGLLIACEIPFEEVTPRKWQQCMGCLSKGDKNVTKSKAQELFPEVKITHAIADALLIAEYARRMK